MRYPSDELSLYTSLPTLHYQKPVLLIYRVKPYHSTHSNCDGSSLFSVSNNIFCFLIITSVFLSNWTLILSIGFSLKTPIFLQSRLLLISNLKFIYHLLMLKKLELMFFSPVFSIHSRHFISKLDQVGFLLILLRLST